MYANFLMLFLLVSNDGGSKMMFGGGGGEEELHRVRKYLERGIFLPICSYHLKRAYNMDKCSFYKLHSFLEAQLKAYFLPIGGTKGDSYVSQKRNPS